MAKKTLKKVKNKKAVVKKAAVKKPKIKKSAVKKSLVKKAASKKAKSKKLVAKKASANKEKKEKSPVKNIAVKEVKNQKVVAKKETVKATKVKEEKAIEVTLWEAANKLRGSVEPAEYKHVVLSLIFLKFASDKFEEHRAKLIAEGKEKYIEKPEFYNMSNVFFLEEISRWNYLIKKSKQNDIALLIDTALHTIEKDNKSLKGALPDNYFSRLGLDITKLASLLDTINDIDTTKDPKQDLVGRVYEYFLSKFALAEGKGKGEFYTPKSIVNLIAEMIEPYKGIIYDPACGSGGMFVQSVKFIELITGIRKRWPSTDRNIQIPLIN